MSLPLITSPCSKIEVVKLQWTEWRKNMLFQGCFGEKWYDDECGLYPFIFFKKKTLHFRFVCRNLWSRFKRIQILILYLILLVYIFKFSIAESIARCNKLALHWRGFYQRDLVKWRLCNAFVNLFQSYFTPTFCISIENGWHHFWGRDKISSHLISSHLILGWTPSLSLSRMYETLQFSH